MMKITTKRILAVVVLLISLSVLLYAFYSTGGRDIRPRTFQTENGWGYTISIKGKVLIKQPFIPAVPGGKPFRTKEDALKAARMVKEKIRKHQGPSLTIEDIQKAGIEL